MPAEDKAALTNKKKGMVMMVRNIINGAMSSFKNACVFNLLGAMIKRRDELANTIWDEQLHDLIYDLNCMDEAEIIRKYNFNRVRNKFYKYATIPLLRMSIDDVVDCMTTYEGAEIMFLNAASKLRDDIYTSDPIFYESEMMIENYLTENFYSDEW